MTQCFRNPGFDFYLARYQELKSGLMPHIAKFYVIYKDSPSYALIVFHLTTWAAVVSEVLIPFQNVCNIQTLHHASCNIIICNDLECTSFGGGDTVVCKLTFSITAIERFVCNGHVVIQRWGSGHFGIQLYCSSVFHLFKYKCKIKAPI